MLRRNYDFSFRSEYAVCAAHSTLFIHLPSPAVYGSEWNAFLICEYEIWCSCFFFSLHNFRWRKITYHLTKHVLEKAKQHSDVNEKSEESKAKQKHHRRTTYRLAHSLAIQQ